MTRHRHDLLREGLITGMIGAVAVAGWFLITYVLFAGTLQLFPWWSVLAANTLALLAMGYYLASRHRSLGRRFASEALGA